MRNFALASLLILAVLGAGTAYFFLRAPGAGGAMDARAASPGAAPGPAAPGPRGNAALAAPREPASAEASQRAVAAADVEVESAPATAARGGVYEILVREGEDGPPVPGIDVRWCLPGNGVLHMDLYDVSRADALVDATENAVRTGPDGRARVPASASESTLIVARSESLWGSRVVGPKQASVVSNGPLEVVVERDEGFQARVVDGAGRPVAGVEVSLRRIHQGRAHATAERVTDVRGLATFTHVQHITERGREDPWDVAIAALLERPVEEGIDLVHLPRTPVELELPATGQVVVRVLDVDGESFRGDGEVELGLVLAGEPREISPFSEISRKRRSADLSGGVAVFNHVSASAEELEIQVTRKGSDIPTRLWARAPVRGGQVEHVVRIGSDHPVLVFRAVDASGKPLAQAKLGVTVASLSQHLSTGDRASALTTDASGAFALDLERSFVEGTVRTLRVWQGEKTAPDAAAEVDLSRAFDPGLHPMGDLPLLPAPIFVSGQVLDATGRPAAKASLYLRRKQNETSDWWTDVYSFRHTTDDEGRFEVRGSFSGFGFAIGARSSEDISEPTVFEPGATGLRLKMRGAGEIVGSFLVDEGIDRGEIQIRIEREAALTHEMRRVHRDGEEFRFKELPPDAYTITLRAEGDREPLAEVRDVVVAAGGEVRDPRLQGIDLRGLAHGFRITLETPAGVVDEPKGRLVVTPHDPDPESEVKPQHVYFRESEVAFVSRHAVIDVEVLATGYRSVELEAVAGDRSVALQSGLQVKIVLDGGAELPEPPIFIKAALADASGAGIDWSGGCFDERREIWVNAPGPGTHTVQWIAERRSSGGALATTGSIGREITLELEDLPGQVFHVALTQAELDLLVQAVTD